MSKWKAIEVILKAKSPIHIGERKMGMVDLTRRWIPGKNFWGAFTAIGAKELMSEYNPKIYQYLGDYLKEVVKFTPFYPYSLTDKTTYIPYYGKGCLEYLCCQKDNDIKTISDYEFDSLNVDSYTSTAIDSNSSTASKSQLHELEFLRPGLGFRGYIIFKEGAQLSDSKNLVENVEDCSLLNREILTCLETWSQFLGDQGLGGDRSRGFGRVSLWKWDQPKEPKTLFYDQIEINQDNGLKLENWTWGWDEEVTVTFGKGDKQISHALLPMLVKNKNNAIGIDLSKVCINNFSGDMEPIVGREWSAEKGAGQKKINATEFNIVSGSTFMVEPITLSIDYFGRAYSK